MQDEGLEVRHEENLREHYAMTCRDWARNLSANWDEAVAEVGPGHRAGLGRSTSPAPSCRFERNGIQLHQILGVKVPADGNAQFPLRPTWGA